MNLPVETQLKFWGIATVVAVVILWFLGDVILPFVLGGAIAYCLDPIADRLERLGCSRAVSTSIITLAAIFTFIVVALLVIPTLIEQAIALFNAAPSIVQNLQTALSERFPDLLDGDSTIRRSLTSLAATLQERGGELVNGVLSSALSLINVVVLIVIVPVVAFYLLLDWDNMVARIDDFLPRDHVGKVRQICRDIDATLASFIRGQGTVCLILGTYYAVALMVVGLNFGLVVGLIAGLISFIPYIGALIGGALAIGLALFQYWGAVETIDGDTITYATNWVRIGIVAAIFFAGQMLEGNVLTPKLVGSSVGLHPVWLLFALSVFGSLFGFVGMLVAVPLAAAIGVIARFFIAEYMTGRMYRGVSEPKSTADIDD